MAVGASAEELPDVSTLRKSASSTQVQRDSAGDEESNADSSDEDVQRATNKHAKGHGGTRLASKPFTARQLQAAAAHAPSLKTNTHDGSAGNARAGAHGRGTKHQRQVEDSGNFSFLTEANGSKRARLAELSDSDESDSAGTGTVPRVRSESVRGVSPIRVWWSEKALFEINLMQTTRSCSTHGTLSDSVSDPKTSAAALPTTWS